MFLFLQSRRDEIFIEPELERNHLSALEERNMPFSEQFDVAPLELQHSSRARLYKYSVPLGLKDSVPLGTGPICDASFRNRTSGYEAGLAILIASFKAPREIDPGVPVWLRDLYTDSGLMPHICGKIQVRPFRIAISERICQTNFET